MSKLINSLKLISSLEPPDEEKIIKELEDEIKRYETRDKITKGILFVQSILLIVAFQFWK